MVNTQTPVSQQMNVPLAGVRKAQRLNAALARHGSSIRVEASSYIRRDLIEGCSIERLQDALPAFTGSPMYEWAPAEELANEILAGMAMVE